MTKLKVDAKTASDLMAQGYTVECYVILPAPVTNTAPKPIKRVNTPPDAKVAVSVELAPTKGKQRVVFEKVKKALWGKDVTKTYSKEEVAAALKKAGNSDTGMFAYCLRQGYFRVVE